MLNVASRDWRVLSENELNLLTTAGALVSLAVERSRLEAAGARALAAEERNRLAREIHDTLAQSLAALTMQLEVVDARAAAQGDRRLAAAATRSLELARSALEEARRSVLDLRAAPLEGRTLMQALERLARNVPAGGALDIRITDGGGRRAGGAAGGSRGRALSHRRSRRSPTSRGMPEHATRRFASSGRPARVRLRVEDDGAGFDPAAVPSGRFGLVGMSERARLLGGTLRLESSPGGGTVVDVTIPR